MGRVRRPWLNTIIKGLLKTRATIDTIEAFFRRPPKGLRTRIEAVLGRRIEIVPCIDKNGYLQGVRVIINRPTVDVLPVLAELQKQDKWCCTCRVDLAFDFVMESESSAEALSQLIDRHIVLKWRAPTAKKTFVERTIYWAYKRGNRNLAMYEKKGNVIRLELRFFNSRAVRRMKLNDLEGLKYINPLEIFQHNLKWARFSDHHIIRTVKRMVAKARRRHLQNRTTNAKQRKSEALCDRYRANIRHRVRHIFETADMQYFASGRGIERLSPGFLQIPSRLDWTGDGHSFSFPSSHNQRNK